MLVVHPFRDTILRQYEKREQIFPGTDILPEFASLTVIRAVQGLGGQNTGYASWSTPWTPCSARWTKPSMTSLSPERGLTAFRWPPTRGTTGHMAVQMSGATQLLFGIKGKRWDTHPIISKQYNEAWVRPAEDEGIANKEAVEGGSYW